MTTGFQCLLRSHSFVLVFACTYSCIPIDINWHDFWAKTQQLGFLKHILPQDRGTSEAPENSVLELFARRIQLCRDPSSIYIFWKVIFENTTKNKIEAWIPALMDVTQRELFAGGLGSIVALLVLRKNWFFCVTVSYDQSSCMSQFLYTSLTQ